MDIKGICLEMTDPYTPTKQNWNNRNFSTKTVSFSFYNHITTIEPASYITQITQGRQTRKQVIPFGEQQNQENLVFYGCSYWDSTPVWILWYFKKGYIFPNSRCIRCISSLSWFRAFFFSTEMSRKLASEISIHLSKLTENDPREK